MKNGGKQSLDEIISKEIDYFEDYQSPLAKELRFVREEKSKRTTIKNFQQQQHYAKVYEIQEANIYQQDVMTEDEKYLNRIKQIVGMAPRLFSQ